MRKKLFILLVVLTGTGTLFAESGIGETRIWPLILDDGLRDMNSSLIVYDLSPDNTESFLYIWADTYTAGTASIQEGAMALTVSNQGWAGGAFYQTGQVAEAVRSLRDSIVSNPEQYYLHLSIKSSDSYSHCFHVFDIPETKFVLGNHSVYDGPVLQDFPRDGEWHDIIVPMSPYASALASVDLTNNNTGINVLTFFSEGVQGAKLSLRNVYFYTGNPFTWDLTNGTLTISGTGAMRDFSYLSFAPWYSSRSSIRSIVINEGVTSIGDYAFYDCSSLTSVTIPNSLTGIGSQAFYNCMKLTSVTIPNSITSIGSTAFYKCSSLTSVTINSQDIVGKIYTNYSTLGGIFGSQVTKYIIGDSVTSIGEYAFYNVSGITSVTIPNSVTSIGSSAFSRCGLTSVTIPNSVTNIEYGVFSGCTSLTSVTIPNSVTSIGNEAFDGCKSLTSVTIPNSVTSIGNYAFDGCKSLTSVHISDLPAWCAISFGGSSANPLYYAHNLYLNDTLVTDLVIPNSVTSIGSYAFSGCSSLTTVTIPDSVTSIGSYAFSGCCSLTTVTIPDSVTSIGSSAFYLVPNIVYSGTATGSPWGARSVNGYVDGYLVYSDETKTNLLACFFTAEGEISIPNSVTNIGDYAFYGCSDLTSIDIPNSVTSIGYNAFAYCSGLANIYVDAITPPAIYSTTFLEITSDAIVHVVFGASTAYKSADYWKNMNIVGPAIQYSSQSLSTSTSLAFNVEDTELQSCGIEGGEQTAGNVLEYIGLEPNSEYKDIPVVLTANTGETETVNVSFTTTALELTTKASKPVSSTTAILLAETNMSDAEVNCGFEYKRNDAPADMSGTKVFCPVASGQMAGRLKNLKDDVYYKYRAFYQSAAGNMYYGDWQYIFTGDVAVEFDPILYTYGATVVRENEATISGYALAGSEDFTEQGFEYWAEERANGETNAPRRMPAALGEHFFVQANGIALRVTLTNLDAGTVYKYRVYGKVGDQCYYGSEQTFTTQGTYEGDDSEAIWEIQSDPQDAVKAQKVLRDGQIYILRGDKIYTITGQVVK